MMNSKEIRSAFLSFFAEKGHQVVPSAPMVVKNDPTLMFTNAGMNQFKDIFLGNEPARWHRVADTQKCLRVSGKHNDLEEVGLDTYHHTMFEMLGNWSFGDYFKKEAIDWAWELLHGRLGIPAERLYATVFEGDASEQLTRDEEAARLWGQYLPEGRILNGNKKDNFWEMGDSGPCGPCSEIHVDIRDEAERRLVPGHELVNRDHPQVIEIWNLVFIQYNRKANGQLETLPASHVDTGMGFERLCMVIQGKKSNYDTDIFQNIIAEIGRLSGRHYGDEPKADIAMRVIADHLRAVSFAIADGQLPSNNKAGYVIRRILRRAVRYGYTFLEFREPFLCRLVEVLKQTMGEAFPELAAQQPLIEKVVREEEESFLRTLDTGIRLLEQLMARASGEGEKEISGRDAFLLYDTYGFPLDLTQLIARENGMAVDAAGFDREMQVQKERSRNAAVQETDDWVEVHRSDKVVFTGYRETVTPTRIARYRRVNQKNRNFFQVVLEKTPFYAESGGQVGDTGYLESNGQKVKVLDTRKDNNLIVHITEVLPADPGAPVTAVVHESQRRRTACNHTATHLLDHALREVLGTHVEQKGSLVHPDYLRFDFSHFGKMAPEELEEVQKQVNAMIRRNLTQEEMEEVPFGEAAAMGAIALFGEKYGETVRVIRFGESIELCGGTHVHSTGQIGHFIILSESAISAGVRRIEAITGEKADEYLREKLQELAEAKALFGQTRELKLSVAALMEENEKLRRQVADFEKKEGAGVKEALKKSARQVGDVTVIYGRTTLGSAQAVKDLAYQLKGEVPGLFLVLGAEIEGKPLLTVMIADEVVKARGVDAGKIVREAGKEIKGGGGGQPFYATAGGKESAGLDAAIAKALTFLTE
ncbi:MAG: alanine--tRNA ligase [Bacteroidales bacterium]|nr:alanine--tRNA ligase [Bacteroidales bacterium]